MLSTPRSTAPLRFVGGKSAMGKISITVVLLALVFSSLAKAEDVYLVVGASAEKPAVIAEKARDLRPFAPEGVVAMTQDCGDRPVSSPL